MEYNKTKRELIEELNNYKEIYEEYKLILDTTYDFISIADKNGVFTRINRPCMELFGVSDSEIIGVSAEEVERKGILKKTMTTTVLKSKKKEIMVQETSIGKKLMITGIPMFDKKGKLQKIINISRDVTEIDKLNQRLNETMELLDWYKNEMYKKQQIDNNFVKGNSTVMKKVVELVSVFSKVNATVLLKGETGCGKNRIAKMIHQISNRREKPFIQVNCGAIPDNLLESEFFGYVEGAFTGANKNGKNGYFQIAEGGTLFLDEIGEIPLHLQVKLLHALDQKEIYKIGSSKATPINVRIIAATKRDLSTMIKEGSFREDLYYRLNVLSINIPALRKRKEDIPALAHFFLTTFNKKYFMNKQFHPKAYEVLASYDWPGNIREMENGIERLVLTCDANVIEDYHILNIINDNDTDRNNLIEIKDIMPLKEAVEYVERKLLLQAYGRYKTTRRMSEVLKIDQSTVVKKLQKIRKKNQDDDI